MSPHAPPHLREIAPILMAGEDVRWMGKPNPMLLGVLDLGVATAASIPLLLFFMIFASDMSMSVKVIFALLAALAGTGILHMTIGTRKYVITDQRLLVVANLSADVHDSCELQDITSVRRPRYVRSLFIERGHGKPIRLWALSDPEEVMKALNIGQLKAEGSDADEESDEAETTEQQ